MLLAFQGSNPCPSGSSTTGLGPGPDRWPAMPWPAAAAYVCSCRVQRLGLCGTRWRLKVTPLKVEAVLILPRSWSCPLYPYTGTL